MFDLPLISEVMLRGVLLTIGAVLWTLLLVRIVGLRAFSKMTAFDFVGTIASGSLIAQAGTRSDWSSYAQCLAAIAGVFLIQWVLAKARHKWDGFQTLIRNQPVLLVDRGRIDERALEQTRVSRSNLMEKLRAADVGRLEDVRAVVLETTGDISVLQGDDIDEELLEGVRRA